MGLVRCGKHDIVFETDDKKVDQHGKGSAALGHKDCPLCAEQEATRPPTLEETLTAAGLHNPEAKDGDGKPLRVPELHEVVAGLHKRLTDLEAKAKPA
jgi:hypothetical protein